MFWCLGSESQSIRLTSNDSWLQFKCNFSKSSEWDHAVFEILSVQTNGRKKNEKRDKIGDKLGFTITQVPKNESGTHSCVGASQYLRTEGKWDWFVSDSKDLTQTNMSVYICFDSFVVIRTWLLGMLYQLWLKNRTWVFFKDLGLTCDVDLTGTSLVTWNCWLRPRYSLQTTLWNSLSNKSRCELKIDSTFSDMEWHRLEPNPYIQCYLGLGFGRIQTGPWCLKDLELDSWMC